MNRSEREELRKKRIEYDESYDYRNSKLDRSIVTIERTLMDYDGRKLYEFDEGNNLIAKLISGDDPVMIARFGGNELEATIFGMTEKFPIINPYKWYRTNQRFWGLYYGAGFFPKNANLIPRFSEMMNKACKEVDLLGCWYLKYEDFIIRHACRKEMSICKLRGLEPWIVDDNWWTSYLKNKKVLVIHPFTETMKRQYEHRERLFDGKEILPDMDIRFIRSVQSAAGNKYDYPSWFSAYDHMVEQVRKEDFEVALIGCGAYGFPLAAEIKRMGKKAVHMGGVTQILFGIMGKRWENDDEVTKYVNSYWTRPDENEQPRLFKLIEGGCYW